jgi:hypothetical protein
MRQCHGIVRRLLISPTEAFISWQLVLSIAIIAIWACPRIECHQLFRNLLILVFYLFSSIKIFITVVLILVVVMLVLFFFIVFLAIFLNNGVLVRVQFIDPSLNATKMERLAALLTVPNGTSLVNGIGADNALLLAFGESFNESFALFGEVMVLVQEILEIIFHR